MPEHRIRNNHKQGNRASFVVRKSEIESAPMIGYDLAVQWISSRGGRVGYKEAVKKDIDASKELRDKLVSLPIKESSLLVEGRQEGKCGTRHIKIPGEVWSLTAVSDCEEAEGEYEWRVEGLGGGDWTAILANRKDPSIVFIELHIESDFVITGWPSLWKRRERNTKNMSKDKMIEAIEELHSLLHKIDEELLPLTLAEAEGLLLLRFPAAPLRQLRDTYSEHSSVRAQRGRRQKSSKRNQRLIELREAFAATAQKA